MSVIFHSHVKQALADLQEKKNRALEIIGGKAESYAKKKAPVGTPESTGIPGYHGGTLRNSITHQQLDESTEIIGSNVDYAPFVELGTYKMAARPFLRPAATEHGEEYKAIISRILNS